MRTRTTILIIIAAVLILVGLGTLLFFYLYEKVERDVHYGASGMARINPYYAAELFFEEMGVSAESQLSLKQLPPTDHTLVLLSKDREVRLAKRYEIEDWVRDGGHLIIVAIPPMSKRGEDEQDNDAPFNDNRLSETDPILSIVGLRVEKNPNSKGWDSDREKLGEGPNKTDENERDRQTPQKTADIKQAAPPDAGTPDADAETKAQPRKNRPPTFMELLADIEARRELVTIDVPCGTKTAEADFDTRWTLALRSSRHGYDDPIANDYLPIFRVPLGNGQVTAIVDSHFMTNRVIGDHDHARLLYRLAVPENCGTAPQGIVFIVRAKAEGLASMLWRHFWMVLISLGILVIAWIWMGSRRFGPILPEPELKRRSLIEHVEAVGNFLWRHGYGQELLKGAREAVRRKMAAHLGGDTELDGLELERAISDETGMRESRVHEAFSGGTTDDRKAFTEAMQELQRIWRER